MINYRNCNLLANGVVIPDSVDVKTTSLRDTKQSHVEKSPCIVRDCFVSRNDMLFCFI
jgi:hypothetical protein